MRHDLSELKSASEKPDCFQRLFRDQIQQQIQWQNQDNCQQLFE